MTSESTIESGSPQDVWRHYVVLHHDHPHPHWDFMVAWGDTLRTWRLATLPRPGITTPFENLPPHRTAYLNYEGPVSRERGFVWQWDRGLCFVEGDHVGLRLRLCGRRLQGLAILTEDEGGDRGTLTWHPDGPAVTSTAAS